MYMKIKFLAPYLFTVLIGFGVFGYSFHIQNSYESQLERLDNLVKFTIGKVTESGVLHEYIPEGGRLVLDDSSVSRSDIEWNNLYYWRAKFLNSEWKRHISAEYLTCQFPLFTSNIFLWSDLSQVDSSFNYETLGVLAWRVGFITSDTFHFRVITSWTPDMQEVLDKVYEGMVNKEILCHK